CGEKSLILRCRPCAWNNQTLRTPPRLSGFSLATLRVSICRYSIAKALQEGRRFCPAFSFRFNIRAAIDAVFLI
ncbi:MAG: hypothetical protein WCA21_08940, partial [Terracidiphilus sp.]